MKVGDEYCYKLCVGILGYESSALLERCSIVNLMVANLMIDDCSIVNACN